MAESEMDEMRPCGQHHLFDPYTNACVPGTVPQFEEQLDDPLIKILHGVVFPALSVLVLVMNGAVIAVLRQQNSKSPTVGPLEWMAVSACLIAASPLPFIVYYYHFGDPSERIEHIALCHLEKICMQMLPFFFNSLTTFFTLLLGIQRFVAVQYPLECSRWCSIRVVRRWARVILVMALFPTALFYMADTRTIVHHCYHIPPPYSSHNRGNYECIPKCYVAHTELAMSIGPDRFAIILDLLKLCLNVIPSSILFVITILLIRTIRIADSSRLREVAGRHRRGPRASTHTTMMLAVVISLFLLARLPITLLLLLRKMSYFIPSLDGHLDFTDQPYMHLINNLMIMTVHPITFGIYMLMSRRFRTSLRHLFGCRFFASDADLQAFSSVRMQSTGSVGRKGTRGMESRFALVPFQKQHRPLTNTSNNCTEQTSCSRASAAF